MKMVTVEVIRVGGELWVPKAALERALAVQSVNYWAASLGWVLGLTMLVMVALGG